MQLPVLLRESIRPMRFDLGTRSIAAVKVLRISLTDCCNMRCVYCMPESGIPCLPRDELLTSNEIVDVVTVAVDFHGITRFKLTGGEPTLRPDLLNLVARLQRIDAIEDLSLTTNGAQLKSLARPLREAGLDRLTISISSLQPDRFKKITRSGVDLSDVLEGIHTADAVGFGQIKINCVAMRGINDDEFANFARLTLNHRWTVRFIEHMPLGDFALLHEGAVANTGQEAFVSRDEIRRHIENHLGPLIPVQRWMEDGVGPATVFRLARGNPLGRIGFIGAMSAPFCDACNRLRLTATGKLRSCLFDGGEVDLRAILRDDALCIHRQRKLADAMVDCVLLKPDVHSAHGNEQMSRLGG